MITARADGVSFAVLVAPKAGKDHIEGWIRDGDQLALKVKVRCAPVDGQANDALLEILSKALSVGTSRLTIARGANARRKLVDAKGDPALLTARLNGIGELQ